MNLTELEEQMDHFRLLKDYDNVRHIATLMNEEAIKQNDSYYQIVSSYHIANSDYLQGNFMEALKRSIQTLTLCKLSDVPFYEMVSNNLVGIIYGMLEDKITSIEYELKAYYIALEHPDMNYIYIIENNLGVLFFNEEMYDTAYNYFLKAMDHRNIQSVDEITFRDGHNIVNLIGCCVKMKNRAMYDKWYPYLTYYLDHFDQRTIHDDALLYRIYEAFYVKKYAEMNSKIQEYLLQSRKNKEKLHTLKNLNDIFVLVLQIKDKELCLDVFAYMKEIISEYPDYRNISKLNDLSLQMNQVFDLKEKEEELFKQYYLNKKREDNQWSQSIKKSLSTKVELEETLHRQEKILAINTELMKNSEMEDFTKVMNKTAFRNHVMQDLNNYKNDQYMVLFVIDLDKFKSINDKYGHLYGDQLLLDCVKVLREETRSIDYIGRVGGDEFCIFMKNILSLEYIKERIELLLKGFEGIKIKGNDHQITASIGVCVVSQKTEYEQMFQRADDLMYKAKKAGGNRYLYEIL